MITILGLGFVGLTTGLGFSKKGFTTYGLDIDSERIAQLQRAEIPFHEPHLQEVLQETSNKTFILDASIEEAVSNSKAIFICVGTPESPDGSADLSILFAAIDQILAVESKEFKTIVIKSTVPPSSLLTRVKPYVEKKISSTGKKIGLASNPEFLREGYCWEDFIEPDRIVIGVEDDESRKILHDLYVPFNAPIHYVSYNTAEYIKYLSNTLLSTMISYSNEMSIIADHIGDIDIPQSFRILHEDKRWSGTPASMASYVFPGCGYGGYCLPKDTAALHDIAKRHGVEPVMLAGNLKTNDAIKNHVVDKIEANLSKTTQLGILGLSFKPESDDVRITPAVHIIKKLIEKGYSNIIAYDPVANRAFAKEYPEINIAFSDNIEVLLDQAEAVLILTGWREFKEYKEKINSKRVFDFRYVL